MALMLFIAPRAHAVSTITASAAGDGVFVVQGVGMANVSAMDLVLTYDTATLAHPRIEQGSLISGAMVASNPNTPGIVRIAIIRTTAITGSGVILTLAFDRTSSSPGTITGLNVRVADINGNSLQALAQIVNPTDTASVGSDAVSQQVTAPQQPKTIPPIPQVPQISTTQVVIAGNGAKPNEDTKPKQEDSSVVPEDQPGPPQEPVAPKAGNAPQKSSTDPVAQPKKTPVLYSRRSVLELFRDYKGARTPKTLIALFSQEPMIGFRQDPLVSLSDGKSTVTVRFISLPEQKATTEVDLTNAKLRSVKKDPDASNTWIVTFLPEANVDSVSLSIPQGDLLLVYPVVVAPKVKADLDRSKTVTKADFTLFLKDRGTPKSPHYDLNNDGVRDYKDEYIFTANYLAAHGK